ncbi:MAG: MFS transporter [Bacteroidales bacterium]|nr:MFS transporter [Bacteroidales bacterium]
MDEKNKNNRILALLFVGVLMGALDISIVGPAIPAIEKSIRVDKQLMSWIFSIYVLANLVGISLMAKLSDLYGRRKIYIISISIFAFGSLVVALSENFNILLIGRAIQGFGASGIFPVASAVVGDIFPPEKRGRTLGLIGAVFGLAFILGPLIAGVVLRFFVWNDLFYINLPIAAFLIYFSNRLLPSKPVGKVSSIDWKGIIILGSLLSAFAYGINRLDANNFTDSLLSVNVIPFLLFSFCAVFLLVYIEKRAETPVVNPGLFLVRQIRLTGLIAIGTGVFQASFVFLPSMAIASFGVATATASFMLLPVVIATALGSPVSGRLLDKYGSRALIIAGLILSAIGFLILSSIGDKRSLFYTGGVFLGLGFSILSGSALRYIMLNEVSVIERASTQGIITIFISIGQMAGAAIIGTLVASYEIPSSGFKQVFFIIAIFAAVLAITGLFLKSRESELLTVSKSDNQI